MRKFTITEKSNGELACRNLSKRAIEFYDGTVPFDVYEYEDADSNKLYAYTSDFGYVSGMTFEQLNEELEEFWLETHKITGESFWDRCPDNWEEIADFLNEKIAEGEDPDDVWKRYCAEQYPDCPKEVGLD